MAVSSTASSSLESALESIAAKGGVTEYQAGRFRTKYADPVALIKAAAMADALANRSLFTVAKFDRAKS